MGIKTDPGLEEFRRKLKHAHEFAEKRQEPIQKIEDRGDISANGKYSLGYWDGFVAGIERAQDILDAINAETNPETKK
jgi:hypothetical protein